jgi:hypothetical protein
VSRRKLAGRDMKVVVRVGDTARRRAGPMVEAS